MYRPQREARLPRYNSKAPYVSTAREYKIQEPHSISDVSQNRSINSRDEKFLRKQIQCQINFEKQNFQCQMLRDGHDLTTEDAQNHFSFLSGKLSSHNQSGYPEHTPSSTRSRLTPSSSGLEQQKEPIIKYLLGCCGSHPDKPLNQTFINQSQTTQNQPHSSTFCRVKQKVRASASSLSPLQEAKQDLQNLQIISLLRKKMIQNLVLIFIRILKLLHDVKDASQQELMTLSNMIPDQVQKIHLLNSYLCRSKET